MISDDGLNRLAIFLGSVAMLLIVLYHFLEINAVEDEYSDNARAGKPTSKSAIEKASR